MDLETRGVVRAWSVIFNENLIPDDFTVGSGPLQTLELSIEGCIDIDQSSTRRTCDARSALIEGDAADSVGATEEGQVEEEAVDSHSNDHPVLRYVLRHDKEPTYLIQTGLYSSFSDWSPRAPGLDPKRSIDWQLLP